MLGYKKEVGKDSQKLWMIITGVYYKENSE